MSHYQNAGQGNIFADSIKHALIAAILTVLMLMPIFALHIEPPRPPETALSLSYEWSFLLYGAAAVFCFQLIRPFLSKGLSGLPRFTTPELTPRHQQLALCLLLLGAFAVLAFGDRAQISIGQLAMIYVILALGLNIVVGFAGLLNLGYAGFYAIGGYTYAVLNIHYGLGFWQSLPIAVVLAAITGLVLGFPVLRLRGDYLAIVTLGFGEIIRLVARNIDFLGGPGGLNGVSKPSVFGYEMALRPSQEGVQTFHQIMGWKFQTIHMQYYLYILGIFFAVCAVLVAIRVSRMPIGRALEAMREDEIACRSLGLNPTALKLIAFTLGAGFAGVAGALFAAKQGSVSPEAFTFLESVLILVAVVVGGMGSLLGVIVGGILIAVLVTTGTGFAEYRMLYFGAILVIMMIWRPQGLLPVGRRQVKVKA
ncbi:high-affinity branched-chain amino acid ABC transporter permease LivM [Microvirga sp. W0021]|uniref:High-affinity branched-chain amino acid ABC transporter permease LivM n=1 Tax=Hohaiivirga grylli TaxID=3133970 RepID=A0ABV0BJN1_9HYPH